MPTSVIRPAGKRRRILFAVEFRKEVSWDSFVVLRRKWRKQVSVFITATWERLLFPYNAKAWNVTFESSDEAWDSRPVIFDEVV